ncbi:MAG: hypothetical protein D6808_04965 [Candidatus Dadabacteria bacterium]|nr:MAG: hypothetical protein D6808_04965 [Candidatus Dadabacteria bacterium]
MLTINTQNQGVTPIQDNLRKANFTPFQQAPKVAIPDNRGLLPANPVYTAITEITKMVRSLIRTVNLAIRTIAGLFTPSVSSAPPLKEPTIPTTDPSSKSHRSTGSAEESSSLKSGFKALWERIKRTSISDLYDLAKEAMPKVWTFLSKPFGKIGSFLSKIF